MPATTSLKLPDALKADIAKVAAFQGKTSHALMVDTLQAAMEDALARQQFYADGEAAYQDSLRTNAVFAVLTSRLTSWPVLQAASQPGRKRRHSTRPSRWQVRDRVGLYRASAPGPGTIE